MYPIDKWVAFFMPLPQRSTLPAAFLGAVTLDYQTTAANLDCGVLLIDQATGASTSKFTGQLNAPPAWMTVSIGATGVLLSLDPAVATGEGVWIVVLGSNVSPTEFSSETVEFLWGGIANIISNLPDSGTLSTISLNVANLIGVDVPAVQATVDAINVQTQPGGTMYESVAATETTTTDIANYLEPGGPVYDNVETTRKVLTNRTLANSTTAPTALTLYDDDSITPLATRTIANADGLPVSPAQVTNLGKFV